MVLTRSRIRVFDEVRKLDIQDARCREGAAENRSGDPMSAEKLSPGFTFRVGDLIVSKYETAIFCEWCEDYRADCGTAIGLYTTRSGWEWINGYHTATRRERKVFR